MATSSHIVTMKNHIHDIIINNMPHRTYKHSKANGSAGLPSILRSFLYLFAAILISTIPVIDTITATINIDACPNQTVPLYK